MSDQTRPQESAPSDVPTPTDPVASAPPPITPVPPPAAPAAIPATPLVWSRVLAGLNPAMGIAIAALLLAGWQWMSAQKESATLQTELALKKLYQNMPGYDEVLPVLTARGFEISSVSVVSADACLRAIECDLVMVNRFVPGEPRVAH